MLRCSAGVLLFALLVAGRGAAQELNPEDIQVAKQAWDKVKAAPDVVARMSIATLEALDEANPLAARALYQKIFQKKDANFVSEFSMSSISTAIKLLDEHLDNQQEVRRSLKQSEKQFVESHSINVDMTSVADDLVHNHLGNVLSPKESDALTKVLHYFN